MERWDEGALQRNLLATSDHTGRRIEAYAADPVNTPFQLVVGAIRTRWQHATSTVPTP